MTTYILPVNFPPAPGPPVTAVSSDSLVDKLGVQIHMAFSTTSYADATQVASLLVDLGVKHVRDTYNVGFPTQHAKQLQVASSAGVKFTMAARLSDVVANTVNGLVSDNMGPILAALEGINEPDAAGGAWATNARNHHQAFYPLVKAQPSLAALPVLAPGLANVIANAAALGDLSAYCDRGNAHVYSGWQPSYTLASSKTAAQTIVGAKPVVITEQGYHNAFSSGSSMQPVDEATAGIYAPKILLENILAGNERVFIYELIDQTNEPSQADIQQHYGLCRYDYSRKPAFAEVKNLLSLLSDPGAPYTPNPLALTLNPSGGDVRSLLTGRRDGSYRLFLWRDVPVWNPSTRVAATVVPLDVTVTHPRGSTVVPLAGELTHLDIPA
jgi:hypothetical protein